MHGHSDTKSNVILTLTTDKTQYAKDEDVKIRASVGSQ